MTDNPWREYDAWEARDRTLLEAAALARDRAHAAGYLWYEEYGQPAPPPRLLRGALDTVLAERYRATSPDEERTA